MDKTATAYLIETTGFVSSFLFTSDSLEMFCTTRRQGDVKLKQISETPHRLIVAGNTAWVKQRPPI
jgi:hypothetical protein